MQNGLQFSINKLMSEKMGPGEINQLLKCAIDAIIETSSTMLGFLPDQLNSIEALIGGQHKKRR